MRETRVRRTIGPRVLAVAALAILIGLFLWLDLDRYLTLAALKDGRDQLLSLQEQSPGLFLAGFFALYLLIAVLSVPGATAMTLGAGALFGLFAGTLIVSVAATAGATLSFLISRYLLRDTVQRRFGQRLRAINEGIERDGAFYLFTLRLVPAFPFFLINLLMGLTPLPLRTFWWVSQVGMLAGTIVYVNAGTHLAAIENAADIASPAVLVSFLLLGLFPWIARFIGRRLAHRRVYARWRRPRKFDRNLIVIGAGAAGLVSAYIAAAVRARVTLVEANRMGGDCLNYGCVPSKALIRGAALVHQMRHADRLGLEPVDPRFSFRRVMERVQEVIAAVEPHDSAERYTRLGVEVLDGHAMLIDPWTVQVALRSGERRQLTTRNILIAAGARPFVPPLPGIDDTGYVTSDTMWERFAQLEQAPTRLVVLGGGPIGCELAQCFARLGSRVTQIEMLPRLLPREDDDVSALARKVLEREGVTVLTGSTALRCEQSNGVKTLVVASDGAEHRIEFDELLCAAGRAARLEGYGLEALGIPVQRTLLTDEYLATPYPNIFAAGDVVGPYQFTHAAAHQAWHATVNALFGAFRKFKVDYRFVPWTTFMDPEVARVGLNEREAQAQGIDHEVTRYELHELDRAIVDGATDGFVKILTAPGRDRILGVTIVGAHAGELLAEYVLAMKHGLGLNRVLGTVHSYPTLAEANRSAAGQWKRAHAPQRILAWSQRYHAWQRG